MPGNNETVEFFGGMILGVIGSLTVFTFYALGMADSHDKLVKYMQKAAIERGAAEWKDKDGKPEFTWREISK